MALEATMKYGLSRIVQAFREYAVEQGWADEDYRLLVRLNSDWGRIHLLVVAKSYSGSANEHAWVPINKYLQAKLKDEPNLLDWLLVRAITFDQAERGSSHTIPPNYVDINDLLIGGPVHSI